ncbi:NAD-dependent epimerase/dehydratase family protein [Variovorax sp. J2P1-59]|uniref:NAD-dependent epimerase/dehydratase family protein n=1 Tax=Variovorax flavidus TaxID=3053501 RepID=UPI0025778A36|nr:NAD-dependent epimerase/dehydratase family protein [Variovorax sp. J2P1-59]MDM0078746.1 NAD-dependent epimerase/dehydratase family protein [Variovorax sp. J2P1-59]
MRVLVTGAAGYVGATLVDAMRARPELGGRRIETLALADRSLDVVQGETAITGDLTEAATLQQVAEFKPDVVFHLAAVPGGASEANYVLGRRVNLDATLALFETLAQSGRRPVVVYASSIAVYGTQLPDPVTPSTPLRPPLTYGAHKLACEVLLADFSRRGLLDGRAVRLPGIVARPRSGAGLTSAFMSDALHALRRGEAFTCPVGPEATAWWMSARRCADNLLHAAMMDVPEADTARTWPLPVLRLSMREVINTCARLYGADRHELVGFRPIPDVEAVFGRYPRLDDASSRALGLRDDGSADALVRRALDETQ